MDEQPRDRRACQRTGGHEHEHHAHARADLFDGRDLRDAGLVEGENMYGISDYICTPDQMGRPKM
jgi:hypothetical protein